MQLLQVKPVYTVPEFVRDFGVCRTTVYEEIKAGRLPIFKVGTSTRIAGEDAMAWRDSHRTGKAA
jgi:excisionase family DNA binding protein